MIGRKKESWYDDEKEEFFYDYYGYDSKDTCNYGDAIRRKHIEKHVDRGSKDEEIAELELDNKWFRETNSGLLDEIGRLKKENSKFRKIKRAHDIIKADKRKLFSVGVLKKCLKNG